MRVKQVSTRRSEQAAETRRRILEGARRVFEERGYVGASVEQIAAAAGVAAPTVYKGFTNKRTLLGGVIDTAMTGTSEGSRVDQQRWWKEQLNEPDPRRQLELIARNARQIYERSARILEVLRAATPLDGELASIWRRISADRLARSRRTARTLIAKTHSGRTLGTDGTALTLFSLTGPELYTTHLAAGRTPDQYERWLARILVTSLLR
jgi:AcrR family transcriptional regulator